MGFVSDLFPADKNMRDVYEEENEKTRQTLIEGFESHIAASNETTEAIQDMHVDVVHGFRNISNELDGLRWELVAINSSLKRMEVTLQGVLDAVADTERAWAYAQYAKSLENHRRGLHQESIERITLAINGHGKTHTGEKEDPRFHFILGSLYCGEIKNPDKKLKDYGKAEKEFLLAARYSEHDDMKEAARAYLLAGISAYHCEATDRALKHIDKSIELNKTLVEAWFQKAKILCHAGKKDGVFDNLLRPVLEHNPVVYVHEAEGDADISKYKDDLEKTIQDASHNLHKKALAVKNQTLKSIDEAHRTFSKSKIIEVPQDVFLNIEEVKRTIKSCDTKMESARKIEEYWGVHRTYLDSLKKYKEVISSFVTGALENRQLETLKTKLYKPIDLKEAQHLIFRDSLSFTFAWIFGVMIALLFFAGCWYNGGGTPAGSLLTLIITELVVLAIAFLILYVFKSNSLGDELAGLPLLLLVLFGCFVKMVWSVQSGFGFLGEVIFLPIVFVVVVGIGTLLGGAVGLVIKLCIPKKREYFESKRQRISTLLQKDIDAFLKI